MVCPRVFENFDSHHFLTTHHFNETFSMLLGNVWPHRSSLGLVYCSNPLCRRNSIILTPCSISYKSLIAVMMLKEVNYHKSICFFILISKTLWTERDSRQACRGHVLNDKQYEVGEHLKVINV